jgi:hypothetical protein
MKTQLLIDYSLICNQTYHAPYDNKLNIHKIIESIMNLQKQYNVKSEDVIICLDGPKSETWRLDLLTNDVDPSKKILPFEYKGGRDSSNRQEINKLMSDGLNILNKMNYQIEKIKGLEADDIIALAAKENSKKNIKSVIVSADKDFIQCLSYKNTLIYNPIKREERPDIDVNRFFYEKTFLGDPSDNIAGTVPLFKYKDKENFGKIAFGEKTLNKELDKILTKNPELIKNYDELNKILFPIISKKIEINMNKHIKEIFKNNKENIIELKVLKETFTDPKFIILEEGESENNIIKNIEDRLKINFKFNTDFTSFEKIPLIMIDRFKNEYGKENKLYYSKKSIENLLEKNKLDKLATTLKYDPFFKE